ncbi:MAG: insulinase family protein [Endomicrobium sp.]|jgi:predicted Zn-dependent peptidase|nr:insulinase family protein [Endomicrobium sp.]
MKSFMLENNIKVIFHKTSALKLVAMRIFTSVSVISENRDNSGISYFTQKLMTQSTQNRPNEILVRDVANIGAKLYGNTEYDVTKITMIFMSKYFHEAVEIISDVILNPKFDSKALFFEKQNVMAVLNSRKDNISEMAHDEFIKMFYGNNTTYSRTIFGIKETILKINRTDLIKWHNYSYNNSNILISIVGNINDKIVQSSLSKYFSRVPDGVKSKNIIFDVKLDKNIKIEIKSKFKQAYIYSGYPACKFGDQNFIKTSLISIILGGRMTSRLFVELREKLGLAYEVNTIYPLRISQSYFGIYMGLDKKNINTALEKIYEVLKNFRTKKISELELLYVKKNIKGNYFLNRETVKNKSYYYGFFEIIGQGYEYDFKYLEYIENITTHDIINIANEIFSKYSVNVVICPE